MTDRSILQRYSGRNGDLPSIGNAAPDGDAPDDLGAFSVLRGVRDRAVMLELRKKDGSILAVGYGWLERVEFDPSEGITLSIGGQKIRIKGRNLNAEVRPLVRLFEGITRHRVPWIQEAGEPESMEADGKVVVIDGISW